MGPAERRILRIRIVLRDGAALGPGKIDLLEAIAETGSIRAAGGRFKMSYRRAWELVAELNGIFSGPLVAAGAGGRGGGGASLTPLGCFVVERFRHIEAEALRASTADLEALAAALPDSQGQVEA